MRCLHCNKKLSLLKLAKGDSFCSAEHFDAYQLQLSKNAYDRLVSLPDEETPKVPLVFKEVADTEAETDSALARLSAFRTQELAVAQPLVASIKAPPKAPPYAGFLVSPLPGFPPHEYAPASVPDANEPVAARRDLAFPVHDVEATVCILTLFFRLRLSETLPRDWTQMRDAIAPPEAFPVAIEMPALAVGPSEPLEIEIIENPVPSEPMAEPLEIEAIENPAPSEQVAEPSEAFPAAIEMPALAAGVAEPLKIEAIENPVPSELVAEPAEAFPGAIEMPALAAGVAEPLKIEAIENPVPSELATEPESPEPAIHLDPAHVEQDYFEPTHADPVEPPAVHVLPIEVQTVPLPTAAQRLAFLVAPSFEEREAVSSPFDDDASSTPRDWQLAPVLDRTEQSSQPWSGRLPQSTGFSRNGSVGARDSDRTPAQSGFALPAASAMLLPKNSTVESYQWQTRDGWINLARPPLELVREATEAVHYTAQVPAPVRPNATLTSNIDRAQILNESAHTILRGVLETSPRGQEPPFQAAPADAVAVALPSILASFPAWKGFASLTWENATGRLSLPTAITDTESRPCLKVAWRQSDVAQPPNPDPAPVGLVPSIHLLVPAVIADQPVLNASTLLVSPLAQTFTRAASADFGQSNWSANVPTGLLAAGDIPSRDKKIGLCSLTANWQPCPPATQEVALFRFLAVRRSPMLPSARAWPRLGALPQ